METLSRTIFVELFGLGTICFLVRGFLWWNRIKGVRSPITEKLLRSPGQSLQRKVDQLNEWLLYSLAIFIFIPVLFAWHAWEVSLGWFVAGSSVLMAMSAVPGILIVLDLRRKQLGLLGERAVGEELNQLMRKGCYVFHDYPAGSNWNIDHIVVGPSGVFAIETKARSKRRPRGREKDYKVVFDGEQLLFPSGFKDSEMLNQARRSAFHLSEQLTKATAEEVMVEPVLSIPGWWVERVGRGDVFVVNAKQIDKVVLTGRNLISEKQIRRIANFIEQKCRDVEV